MNRRFADLARDVLAGRDAASLMRRRRVVERVGPVTLRIEGREVVDFGSNDYLGLSHHPGVLAAMRHATAAGSGAAALLAGRTIEHDRAERALAVWKGTESAVLLPSGLQANLAAVQTAAAVAKAAGRTPRFLIDKLAHASLLDAVDAATDDRRQKRVFPHNDIPRLAELMSRRPADEHDIVITESVFGMDGDTADLPAIAALRSRHEFTLIVDEAHASGLRGPHGAGLVAELRLTQEVDLAVATFSKALGVIGGAVYGSGPAIEAVVNVGRAYLFSTSPPPAIAASILQAIHLAQRCQDRRDRLGENVHRVRSALRLPGDTPIVPLIVGDAARVLQEAARLLDAGFFVPAVRPPTVAPQTSRLRITLSSEHTQDMLIRLIDAIAAVSTAGSAQRIESIASRTA